VADEDFDILGLADYLHLAPERVSRMVERGQIPGQRIGGQWRFRGAEIHHWLEARIGVLDERELMQIEGALERAHSSEDGDVRVVELLPRAAIAVPLEARTKSSVLDSMIGLAAQTGYLWDPERMAEAVRQREALYPTSLDNGVALLHPRRPLPSILAEPFLALGITQQGIAFGGRHLTDVFFLICSTSDAGHLRTLARLSRLLTLPEFLPSLRAAASAGEAMEVIDRLRQYVDTGGRKFSREEMNERR